MRRYLALLGALVALLGGGTAAGTVSIAPAAAAKTCSSGYRHAVIGGAEKCLRTGEFCTHAYDVQYRRYGYRCASTTRASTATA